MGDNILMDYSGAVLISVYDKTGVEEIAAAFVEKGAEIYSTGGTARYLREHDIPVTDVSEVTGFPEILDGRVKTLHPRIFGGILADRNTHSHTEQIETHNIKPVIAAIINFYPFQAVVQREDVTFQEIIENIDIGGPSMLRAAAKNHQHVLPVCRKEQFAAVLNAIKNDSVDDIRVALAREAFLYTLQYEQSIAGFFSEQQSGTDESDLPDLLPLTFKRSLSLRYGENPHQHASFYEPAGEPGFDFQGRQLQGKDLSYNNLLDLDSAIRIIQEFRENACVIIKHTNPCGFAYGEDTLEAYQQAVTTDPVSYFGGIVGFNQPVDGKTAEELTKSFLECIVAPDFSDEAIETFKSKKNLRIIRYNMTKFAGSAYEIRPAFTGYLLQDRDPVLGDSIEMNVVTDRKPTASEEQALRLAWRLVKHTKSNGILFANERKALGVGAGQMSRVDSVKIAVRKAGEANLSLDGASMASDAFFPFPDGVETAAEAGI
ncbi:MAG: bifunctional phosphoribosylaminoimidazolecarboxamide formyltransferase/IMP cyclohydrolase, partial [Candidatus Marinimicrobia bacterium]|nr:bifunctional phosphoribosylaminoimidazolecarboxamide formyltransferase/IMP cyclohydrolase [Candidatus Neomarinimicrobiota bacterium]